MEQVQLKKHDQQEKDGLELGKTGFPGGSVVRIHLPMQETQVQFLSRKDPLEEETTAHTSILTWEIPWTEEPHWLQSMWPQKSWTRVSD